MKTKITIEDEFTGSKLTIERPTTGDFVYLNRRQAILNMFEDALRGLGFNFTGSLEIVEDEK